jgi:hypothetical protein
MWRSLFKLIATDVVITDVIITNVAITDVDITDVWPWTSLMITTR